MGMFPRFVRFIPDKPDEDGDDKEDGGTAEYVKNIVDLSDDLVLAGDAGLQLYFLLDLLFWVECQSCIRIFSTLYEPGDR